MSHLSIIGLSGNLIQMVDNVFDGTGRAVCRGLKPD